MLQDEVRKGCAKPEVISERKVSRGFFTTSARRKLGQEALPYRVRREQGCEQVKRLLTDVVIPAGCRGFFALEGMGVTEEERLDTFKEMGNIYANTDKMV